ncbi:type II toxin-antitoxin system VapC family toxin [Methylocystis sp. 9N]|uniref:Type II toxin-antitoxin system VapC family toxin n=1 Tax=Methylocystis borbori TaxID=3118750 RepID=A0ABU7XIN5_9HYPH
MRLLLDTHILLGLIEKRLAAFGAEAKSLLENPDAEFVASVASLWEIAIKGRLGKLELAIDLDALPELLEALGVELISINAQHALSSVEPEPRTRDPFDRLLLAQCKIEALRLVTMDRALVDHPLAARTA